MEDKKDHAARKEFSELELVIKEYNAPDTLGGLKLVEGLRADENKAVMVAETPKKEGRVVKIPRKKLFYEPYRRIGEIYGRLGNECSQIIKYFGMVGEQNQILVLEHFPHLNIEEMLTGSKTGTIGIMKSIEIAKEILKGIGYCHEKGVYHSDLNPQNVLVNELGNGRYEIRLIDFGHMELVKTSKKALQKPDLTYYERRSIERYDQGSKFVPTAYRQAEIEPDPYSDLFGITKLMGYMMLGDRDSPIKLTKFNEEKVSEEVKARLDAIFAKNYDLMKDELKMVSRKGYKDPRPFLAVEELQSELESILKLEHQGFAEKYERWLGLVGLPGSGKSDSVYKIGEIGPLYSEIIKEAANNKMPYVAERVENVKQGLMQNIISRGMSEMLDFLSSGDYLRDLNEIKAGLDGSSKITINVREKDLKKMKGYLRWIAEIKKIPALYSEVKDYEVALPNGRAFKL